MAAKHEIGILFVHGIGSQRRGETLLDFGEPLCDWVQRWIAGASESEKGPSEQNNDKPSPLERAKVIFDKVVLKPAHDSPPAYAEFRIQTDTISSSWLLAEAHWADSFPPPHFPQVARWTMKVLPWVFASLINRWLRQALSSKHRGNRVARLTKVVSLVLLTLLASPLTVLLELTLLLLMLIWIIPIPAVRKYLQWVYENLAQVIGDSHIFVSSAMRKQAVIDRVRRQLNWLERRCEKLVIVAHSQGAAVTYLTLGSDPPKKLRVLFTFGSGLLKLSQLSSESMSLLVSMFGFFSFIPTMLLTALLARIFGVLPATGWTTAHYVTIPLLFLVVVAIGQWGAAHEDSSDLREWAKSLEKGGIHWTDVFASADPVPNGPLFPAPGPREPQVPHSVEIRNGNSLLKDHTSYKDNIDEFVSLLVTTISRYADTTISLHNLTKADEATLQRGPAFRHADLAAQKWDSLLLGISALVVLANAHVLSQLGLLMMQILSSAPSWLAMTFFGSYAKDLNGQGPPPAIIGAIAVALTYFVLKKIVDAVWSWLTHLRLLAFFERQNPEKTRLQFLFIAHIIPGVTASLAVHSTWGRPMQIFESLSPAPWSPLVYQMLVMGIGLAFLLTILDMFSRVTKGILPRKNI